MQCRARIEAALTATLSGPKPNHAQRPDCILVKSQGLPSLCSYL